LFSWIDKLSLHQYIFSYSTLFVKLCCKLFNNSCICTNPTSRIFF